MLQVGAQVLTSNPTLGVRPVFTTIGAPWEEIFHEDEKAVFITEGLVRECDTDGKLAAVLCHELGKMEADAGAVRAAARSRPADGAPVGTDYGGAFGPPDGTRAMELAVYERKRRKTEEAAAAQADADALARDFVRQGRRTARRLAGRRPAAPRRRRTHEVREADGEMAAALPCRVAANRLVAGVAAARVGGRCGGRASPAVPVARTEAPS